MAGCKSQYSDPFQSTSIYLVATTNHQLITGTTFFLNDELFVNLFSLRIDLNCFSVHEEINSKMWYTLCNPRSGLRKGVYHIFEFISNEPNKKL